METAHTPDLAQVLLKGLDSPLSSQLLQIGREMERLHEKLTHKSCEPTAQQMIQAFSLSTSFEICLLHLMHGKTDAIEFEILNFTED